MGNRAVLTIFINEKPETSEALGIYVHWNGGRDSIQAFLTYCELQGYKGFNADSDENAIAKLYAVIHNFFGGESVYLAPTSKLDCDNFDNGVYLIEDWEIVGRLYHDGEEQNEYDFWGMLEEIDERQPKHMQLGKDKIIEKLTKILK